MAVASLSHLWIWLLAPAVPRSLPSPWPALVALVGRAPNPIIQAQLQTLVDVEVLEPPRPKSLVSAEAVEAIRSQLPWRWVEETGAAEVEAIRSQLPWRWVEETGAEEVEAARRQLPLRVLTMAQRRLHPLQVSRVLAVAQESRGAMAAATTLADVAPRRGRRSKQARVGGAWLVVRAVTMVVAEI